MAKQRGEGLTRAEARRLVEGYEESGLTRREYCGQAGVPLTTFDYYRRKESAKAGSFVPVEVVGGRAAKGSFALVLGNGRRIEGDWGFAEEALKQLVRIAEQA